MNTKTILIILLAFAAALTGCTSEYTPSEPIIETETLAQVQVLGDVEFSGALINLSAAGSDTFTTFTSTGEMHIATIDSVPVGNYLVTGMNQGYTNAYANLSVDSEYASATLDFEPIITPLPLPVAHIEASADTVYVGEQVNITAASENGVRGHIGMLDIHTLGGTYPWTPSSPGTFTISYIVFGLSGMPDTDEVQVVVKSRPTEPEYDLFLSAPDTVIAGEPFLIHYRSIGYVATHLQIGSVVEEVEAGNSFRELELFENTTIRLIAHNDGPEPDVITHNIVVYTPQLPGRSGNLYSAYEQTGQVMGGTVDISWFAQNLRESDQLFTTFTNGPVALSGNITVPVDSTYVIDGCLVGDLYVVDENGLNHLLSDIVIPVVDEPIEPQYVTVRFTVEMCYWMGARPTDPHEQVLLSYIEAPEGTVASHLRTKLRFDIEQTGESGIIGIRDEYNNLHPAIPEGATEQCPLFDDVPGVEGIAWYDFGDWDGANPNGEVIAQHAIMWDCYTNPDGTANSFTVKGIEFEWTVRVQ